MIYIETGSEDVYFNFGLELYFAAEKKLDEPVLLFWTHRSRSRSTSPRWWTRCGRWASRRSSTAATIW